jgi:signal transduction histidine kinase
VLNIAPCFFSLPRILLVDHAGPFKSIPHRPFFRSLLEQITSNLLSNAIKYGPGKPVDVNVHAVEGTARLTVRDYGIGIAHEAVARIFDRFERAVSPRHYGGLGLGLYIARQIVEAHRGSILVRSEPGAGSTFTVVLPLDPGTQAPNPEASSPDRREH